MSLKDRVDKKIKELVANQDAKTHVTAGSIIGFSIAVLIFAAIGTGALNTTITFNTSTWGTTNIALYGLIILAIIIGFVYMFLPAEWRK